MRECGCSKELVSLWLFNFKNSLLNLALNYIENVKYEQLTP